MRLTHTKQHELTPEQIAAFDRMTDPHADECPIHPGLTLDDCDCAACEWCNGNGCQSCAHTGRDTGPICVECSRPLTDLEIKRHDEERAESGEDHDEVCDECEGKNLTVRP